MSTGVISENYDDFQKICVSSHPPTILSNQVMGHVEFRLFFLVLDNNDPFLILGKELKNAFPRDITSWWHPLPHDIVFSSSTSPGLDQMRRFKCLVDLESNVLRFGGKEGVEVPFLDPEMSREAANKKILLHHPSPSSSTPQSAASSTNGNKKANSGGGLFGGLFK